MSVHLWIRAAGCLAILWPLMTAAAGEGVREINQAAAQAGGVTAADGPGFPVLISESGSYVLTGDLDLRGGVAPADTTAVEITADFVWLDLNGFSIIGPFDCALGPPPAAGSGDGIASVSTHVTVIRGHVRGIGRNGVSLGDHARVRDLTVTCSGGRGIAVGARSVVTDNSVDHSGDFGLDLGPGSSIGGNVLSANDGGGAGIGVAASSPLVELQPGSCDGTTTCEICGDGSCAAGEGCASCPGDCGACGPKLVSARTRDPFTVDVTFSEPVDDASVQAADFSFAGFVSAGANAAGVGFSTGGVANDEIVRITLAAEIGPDETGVVALSGAGVVENLSGNGNTDTSQVPVTDGIGAP